MSLTNASANLAGLLAPITAGHLIHGKVIILLILIKLFIIIISFLANNCSVEDSFPYSVSCILNLCIILCYFWTRRTAKLG